MPDVVLVRPLGGVCDLHTRPFPAAPGDPIAPVWISVTCHSKVTLTAVDLYGHPVAWERVTYGPATVDFDAGMGYFQIVATSEGQVAATAAIGVIPPHHPGVRPDSFFAANTGGMWGGETLEKIQALGLLPREEVQLAQVIGMKVMRSHFQEIRDLAWQDGRVRDAIAHDTWILPIVGYPFPGRESELARQLQQHGPPDDFAAFVADWRQIVERYPEITTYEFWNEPWIFEWTWADTPAAYRDLQTRWCQMALAVNPNLRIIAGNSWAFVEDHIEPYPACWRGLLRGISHHPYPGAMLPHNRNGETARTIDNAVLVARRMGLRYAYMTEGGAWYGIDTVENAQKLPHIFIRAALSGAYQGNAQWGIGTAPGWTRPNTAYAVMTHFLEDRPIVADIWPDHELIFGAIFANPRHVTAAVRALPRADELSLRWEVPIPAEYANDPLIVAAVWGMTGLDNDHVDTGGTIAFPADGLRAFNLVGHEFAPVDGQFVLPLDLNTLYITTETLSVVALRERIAAARIDVPTPVNLYALSLLHPAEQPQTLIARVENQLNVPVTGTLSARLPDGRMIEAPYAIEAGQLADIALPWPGVTPREANQYPVTFTAATLGHPAVTISQVLQVARIARRTITIDGTLDDWRGVTPITILPPDTPQDDVIEYILNPYKPRETREGPALHGARVYVAYDDDNVYIAVHGLGTRNPAGTLWHPDLPYRRGMPDGLQYPALIGDAVQVAFGFRDRVPGYGRQMDDPYRWKGQIYDTDYQAMAYNSTDGPQWIRQWGPHTPRGTAYQIDEVPDVVPVPGGQIALGDEVYEMAIPRAELAFFNPAAGQCRFGVVLNGAAMSWSRTANVFDHWQGSGSFGPAWATRYPCQTFFGIEP